MLGPLDFGSIGEGMLSRRRWVLAGALIALGGAAVLLLWPVLFSPVTADDRYWFIEVPARTDLSFLEAIRTSIREIPAWLETGRVAPLAFLARRVMLLGSFKFSVAASTPLVATQGIAKLLLFLVGMASCLAFVTSLRWRAEGGRLVRVGARQLTVIGVALVPLVASGAQAHTQFRNGWISYPVLTYGAITVVFGSGALVAWCTRRVTERRRGAVWIGIVSMILLGTALNTSYELYYVAFPLALAVLLVFPYAPHRKDHAATRARLIVGGTLSLTFISVLLAIRQLISAQCAARDCYVGTEPSLGGKVLVTLWNNFFTSIPGVSHSRFLAELDELGQSWRWPDPATIAVILVGVLIAGGVLAVWKAMSDTGEHGDSDVMAERRLLLATSGTALGVGVGGALIMSLSVQAQEVIASVGLPYRHIVLTWTAIALSLVTLALALSRTRSPTVRWAIPFVLVALIILASSFSLPRNLVSNQVYHTLAANRAIADIHWEVVAGDRGDIGDERRCQTLERAEAAINNAWLEARLEPATDQIFRRLYGVPYCSTWPDA